MSRLRGLKAPARWLLDAEQRTGSENPLIVVDCNRYGPPREFADGLLHGYGIQWDVNEMPLGGRWEGGELKDSNLAVPTRLIPFSVHIIDHIGAAPNATLFWPSDGHYYSGPLDAEFKPHTTDASSVGILYNMLGNELRSGWWKRGRFSARGLVEEPRSPPRLLASSPAGRRRALLIGVNDYSHIRPLSGCINDCNNMQRALQRLDFVCQSVENPTLAEMKSALTTFVDSLEADDVAFIHFSGHGADRHHVGYLMPSDFPGGSNFDKSAISTNSTMKRFEDRKLRGLRVIMLLDCCRHDAQNTTFKAQRSMNDEAQQRPPSPVAAEADAAVYAGVTPYFIMYACDPGQVAYETGLQRQGDFTSCVLQFLTLPALTLGEIYNRAAEELTKKGRKQCSWNIMRHTLSNFKLMPAQANDAAAAPSPANGAAAAASAGSM